jgi:hypothetical protein
MASARVEVLRVLLIERRKAANLRQAQLAEKLGSGWHQFIPDDRYGGLLGRPDAT